MLFSRNTLRPSFFSIFRDEKSFTDVTIACDGQSCKVGTINVYDEKSKVYFYAIRAAR